MRVVAQLFPFFARAELTHMRKRAGVVAPGSTPTSLATLYWELSPSLFPTRIK